MEAVVDLLKMMATLWIINKEAVVNMLMNHDDDNGATAIDVSNNFFNNNRFDNCF